MHLRLKQFCMMLKSNKKIHEDIKNKVLVKTPTSLDICVYAISYQTSFGYSQKHNINLQLVWWFSKRHFDLVQVCDWLFRNKCLYICRCRKHAHNCYPLTLWDWLLLVVIWTWEISGSESKERTVRSLVKMYAMLYCFITYASFSTVSRVADTVGYTANEL